jgi:hypothetical protein
MINVDSNTCSFSADKLWGLWEFYEKNFTEFVYGRTGMTLLFDLMIGVTYHDVAALKVISKDTLELTGNARSLQLIIQSMKECPGLVFEINVPEESLIPSYTENNLEKFIREKGCCLFRDTSNYTVQFKKLN